VLCELVCNPKQLPAGVRVSEGPDAQTVGWIQLPLEELAAGLLDLSQLEEAGCGEQRLDVPLLYSYLREGRDQQIRCMHNCYGLDIKPLLIRSLSKSGRLSQHLHHDALKIPWAASLSSNSLSFLL